MERSPRSTAIVLAVCFLVGIGLVLLLTGGDDDDPAELATTPATAPPPVTSTETTATTPPATGTRPRTSTNAAPPPPPPPPPPGGASAPLETSPERLRERARDRAAAAKRGGARSCPDLSQPARAIDITAQKVSCATARKVIFATTPKQRNGFACDIVAESFADVPAIEYSCRRKADAARIGYTAVG